jgi:ABC-2 type transport system ATP-binding protein
MSHAIDLAQVQKIYKGGLFGSRVHALRGVDLKVGDGEIFGLLGPNGAGKSTLVKIMMTVIRPSNCSGTVLGKKVGDKATLGRIGYLPEHHRFPEYLTSRQMVEHFGALSGVSKKDRRRRSMELLETVGMKDWADAKIGSYSKGMRQRVGLAQALINDPKLVVLDEPTDGVDPTGRRDIREILTRLKDEGRTVFLNSHLLSELEMVCDRVAIMVKGLVRTQGTIDELTTDQRHYTITVSESDKDTALTGAKDVFGDAAALVPGRAGVVRIDTAQAERVQPVIDKLRGAGVVIHAVTPFRPSLEDLFMQVVQDGAGGETPGAFDSKKGGRS